MKTINKTVIGLLVMLGASLSVNAQVTPNAGVEIVAPLESGYGIGFGIRGGAEYALKDNSGITGQLGFTFLSTDLEGAKASMIPIQFGYKYYLDSKSEGFYGKAELGVHVFKFSYEYETIDGIDFTTGQILYRTVKVSDSNTNLSFAAGGGYMINENVDLGVRYNVIFGDGANFNYLAFSAAYSF